MIAGRHETPSRHTSRSTSGTPLFSALHFLIAALPAVFFVRHPRVAFRWIVAVGLALGVAKFGLLFTGMRQGMPAGLSSLVLQVQAVFAAVLAAVPLRERLSRTRLFGMAPALLGIGVAAVGQGTAGPLGAFALTVAAAAFWGPSNILTRKASPPDAFSWMVWVSLVPSLPLIALSLLNGVAAVLLIGGVTVVSLAGSRPAPVSGHVSGPVSVTEPDSTEPPSREATGAPSSTT